MNKIERAYLKIIFEENYSDENWMKCESYKNIDFYVRKDGHLMNRLNERYGEKFKLINVIRILQKFIKTERNEVSFLSKIENGFSISYTIYAKLLNMYVSGRFKCNNGAWRCYIVTVLPNKDTHFNKSDFFKELYI